MQSDPDHAAVPSPTRTPAGRRSTRATDVANRIRADVVRGVFPVGSRLKEEMLAERYGTSRTPVREALRALARESLLRYRPQAGYEVASISLGQMDDLYSVRVAIEEQAAARLVDLVDLSPLEPLERFWDTEPDLVAAPDGSLVFADEEFHEALAQASGSTVFPELLRNINQRMHLMRVHDFYSPERVARTYQQHASILRALRRRDARLVRALLRAHIWESHAYVREAALRAGTAQ